MKTKTSGKSARRYSKAVDCLDRILEFAGNMFEKTLLCCPQINGMSDESDSSGKVRKVVAVEIPE